MSGALMQLSAYGVQDVYLTGSPSASFFRSTYRRHTNFAMEASKQFFNGQFDDGGIVSAVVARNGDLLGDTWLELPVKPSLGFDDLCWVAERAIDHIDFIIGGNLIDRHYQTWWRMYSEVFLDESRKIGWGKMTTCPTQSGGTVILPLLFFFCRHPGLFLPLVALQNHEVRLEFTLSPSYSTWFSGPATLWSNYILLDGEERRRLSTGRHEYLIEQVQMSSTQVTQATFTSQIVLTQPVKELIWCYKYTDYGGSDILWNFAAPGTPDISCDPTKCTQVLLNQVGCPLVPLSAASTWVEDGDPTGSVVYVGPLSNFKLVFNNEDRFLIQNAKYFNQYQPFRYHSGTPYPGIYVYSFALEPEKLQPSGTCNFSRIHKVEVSGNIKTVLTPEQPGDNFTMTLFAVNYNILTIKDGMGCIAFAN